MATMYERIYALCQEKGVKPGTACREAGVNRSVLTEMKAGRTKELSAKTSRAFAEYFGISVAELISGEKEQKETPMPVDMSDVDLAFYGEYRELSDDDQATIRDMVRVMRERRK